MISGKSGLALDQVTASEGGSSWVFILFEGPLQCGGGLSW
jgi:hypothetical protein